MENDIVARFDKEEFIQDFMKKMKSVLLRVPIKAEVRLIEPKVIISVLSRKDDLEYELDYTLPVKKNIFNIRKDLMDKTFPTFIVETFKEVPYSPDEQEKLIHEEGYSVETALSAKKKIVSRVRFKIDKVIIDHDKMIVLELDTGKRFLFKLKRYPISIFLKNLRTKWVGEEGEIEAGAVFNQHSIFLERIYSEKEYAEMKNNQSVSIGEK